MGLMRRNSPLRWCSGLRSPQSSPFCSAIRACRIRPRWTEISSRCLLLHPTKHFPHISLLVLGALAFLFSVTLKLETAIAGILAMRLLVQFIGQAIGVMVLRKRWGAERLPFKMWLYPVPAVLTMLGWAWLFWQTGTTRKWGLAEIALGALAFLIRAREVRQWPFESRQLS